MLRFIYFCMAIVAFSFLIVPMVSGISNLRDNISEREIAGLQPDTSAPSDDTLSFEEVYELAAETQITAESLNDIAPAAGDSSMPALPEDFSVQIEPEKHPAL